MSFRTFLCTLVAAVTFVSAAAPAASPSNHRKTRRIVWVMTDGLRRQEMFHGVDPLLLNKEHGKISDIETLRRKYWRDTPQARRGALLPFVWSTLARSGQIYGNRDLGSEAFVTNRLNFSYPGYSEALCGFVDPGINSNNKIPNPNVTVLEWLHRRPAYRGKVAAFAAWDVFSFILNAGRAGFPVTSGYDPFVSPRLSPRMSLLNELKAETPRIWEGEPVDALTFHTALEYLRHSKPHILFLSLGETDEWAHAGEYGHYLDAARRVDSYLETLWNTLQAMPEYRGVTTLVFATDHGRGEAPAEWRSHGEKLPDSKYVWMGFLGPDTPPLGERSRFAPVTQDRIAATVAALLGEDYAAAVPRAGKAILDVLPR